MARLWGAPDFRYVMMAHPLATLSEAEIEARAAALVDRVLALLQQGQTG
ncbi:MAG TPA: hypothetical protein VKF40_11705 [Burkholderiales bacterium]|nr:hypothetical protein [Burkholderiales bacterium]